MQPEKEENALQLLCFLLIFVNEYEGVCVYLFYELLFYKFYRNAFSTHKHTTPHLVLSLHVLYIPPALTVFFFGFPACCISPAPACVCVRWLKVNCCSVVHFQTRRFLHLDCCLESVVICLCAVSSRALLKAKNVWTALTCLTRQHFWRCLVSQLTRLWDTAKKDVSCRGFSMWSALGVCVCMFLYVIVICVFVFSVTVQYTVCVRVCLNVWNMCVALHRLLLPLSDVVPHTAVQFTVRAVVFLRASPFPVPTLLFAGMKPRHRSSEAPRARQCRQVPHDPMTPSRPCHGPVTPFFIGRQLWHHQPPSPSAAKATSFTA